MTADTKYLCQISYVSHKKALNQEKSIPKHRKIHTTKQEIVATPRYVSNHAEVAQEVFPTLKPLFNTPPHPQKTKKCFFRFDQAVPEICHGHGRIYACSSVRRRALRLVTWANAGTFWDSGVRWGPKLWGEVVTGPKKDVWKTQMREI